MNQLYDYFSSKLNVSKHLLDDALETHADMQRQINDEVVRANSTMLRAKADLENAEARLVLDIRSGEDKTTIDAVKAQVRQKPEWKRAWQSLHDARAEHERWSGLFEAWRQRGYSITSLSNLYGHQYFALDSTQAPKSREERMNTMRARMREAQPAPRPRKELHGSN